MIRNIVARWPGSTHDACIFANSAIAQSFEIGQYNDDILLGDGVYPCKRCLMTSLRNPTTQPERRYNVCLSKARCVVERTFGVWKKRFPCLHLGLRTRVDNSLTIIIATAVLRNLARHQRERKDLFIDLDNDDNDHHVQMGNMIDRDATGFAKRALLINNHFSGQ